MRSSVSTHQSATANPYPQVLRSGHFAKDGPKEDSRTFVNNTSHLIFGITTRPPRLISPHLASSRPASPKTTTTKELPTILNPHGTSQINQVKSVSTCCPSHNNQSKPKYRPSRTKIPSTLEAAAPKKEGIARSNSQLNKTRERVDGERGESAQVQRWRASGVFIW